MNAFIVPTISTRQPPISSSTTCKTESKVYLCPPRRPHAPPSKSILTKTSKSTIPSTKTRIKRTRARIITRAGLSSTPPRTPSFHPNNNDDLHWKDRVALYAQFSPEETLHVILNALQSNARTGPYKDDGIDALYAFANVDIWALTHRFFGKTQDLGQFERFKRVVVAHPYNILLSNSYESKTLSALHVAPETYVTRRVFECSGETSVFTFTLRRMEFGGKRETKAWMVDSIIHDHNINI